MENSIKVYPTDSYMKRKGFIEVRKGEDEDYDNLVVDEIVKSEKECFICIGVFKNDKRINTWWIDFK